MGGILERPPLSSTAAVESVLMRWYAAAWRSPLSFPEPLVFPDPDVRPLRGLASRGVHLLRDRMGRGVHAGPRSRDAANLRDMHSGRIRWKFVVFSAHRR